MLRAQTPCFLAYFKHLACKTLSVVIFFSVSVDSFNIIGDYSSSVNNGAIKMVDHFEEYRRKIASGEIERPVNKNPIEKALAKPNSMRAAINAKCYDCAGHQVSEIRLCVMSDCPLFNFRPYQVKESK